MLHARKDYNRRIQDVEDVIPEDEPVFLLRAQDKHAPATLDNYSNLVAKGENPDQILIANTVAHAKAMRKWQDENVVKEPDMDATDALYLIDEGASEAKTSEDTTEEEEEEEEEED